MNNIAKAFSPIVINNLLICIINSVLLILFGHINEYVIYVYPLINLVSIGLIIYHYKTLFGNVFNYCSMMVISLTIFSMGRQFTQQFGYTSETFFLRNHTPSELSYAYLFTYYCIFFFYLGTIIRLPQKNNVPQIDDFTIRKINKLFFKILLICIAPMLWYYFKLITVAQIAAYGSREFDAMTADTGYLVSYMRVFGVISTIGLICISYMSGKKSIILHLFYFFVIGLSLLSGSRTEGMGLLLLLIMLYTNRNQTSGKAMIIATLLLLLLSTLIPLEEI